MDLQVQGVYFRNFTVQKATALRLVGWVANTMRGTVGETLLLLLLLGRRSCRRQQLHLSGHTLAQPCAGGSCTLERTPRQAACFSYRYFEFDSSKA